MTWFPASLGHKRPWYWLYRISKFLSYVRKDFKYLCSQWRKFYQNDISVSVSGTITFKHAWLLHCNCGNIAKTQQWSTKNDAAATKQSTTQPRVYVMGRRSPDATTRRWERVQLLSCPQPLTLRVRGSFLSRRHQWTHQGHFRVVPENVPLTTASQSALCTGDSLDVRRNLGWQLKSLPELPGLEEKRKTFYETPWIGRKTKNLLRKGKLYCQWSFTRRRCPLDIKALLWIVSWIIFVPKSQPNIILCWCAWLTLRMRDSSGVGAWADVTRSQFLTGS